MMWPETSDNLRSVESTHEMNEETTNPVPGVKSRPRCPPTLNLKPDRFIDAYFIVEARISAPFFQEGKPSISIIFLDLDPDKAVRRPSRIPSAVGCT